MARNPKRPGISYFGKKVETQEIRFDKNVFFEKQKSSDSNVVTTPATLFNGRQFREVKGRRRVVLADVALFIIVKSKAEKSSNKASEIKSKAVGT